MITGASTTSLKSQSALRAEYEQLSDIQLVCLCQRKDHYAFEALIKRYGHTIQWRLHNFLPNQIDQADAIQETYIRMWENFAKLRNPRAFKTWMLRLATNVVYDHFRKKQREGFQVSLDEPVGDSDEDVKPREIRDPADGPEQLYDRKCMLKAVGEAIAELPPQFKATMVLRDLNDLSYEEIAVITTSDLGTVKSRLSRARQKVQKILVHADYSPCAA